MRLWNIRRAALWLPALLAILAPRPAMADGNIRKVNHIIIIMQENHSFDNYFRGAGVRAGEPLSHAVRRLPEGRPCLRGRTGLPSGQVRRAHLFQR